MTTSIEKYEESIAEDVSSNADPSAGALAKVLEASSIPGVWSGTLLGRMLDLPYHDDGWQEGAVRTSVQAAAGLLVLLEIVGPLEAGPPDVCPLWNGGVQAEWHHNQHDVEVELWPNGDMSWECEDLSNGKIVSDQCNFLEALSDGITFLRYENSLSRLKECLVELGGAKGRVGG